MPPIDTRALDLFISAARAGSFAAAAREEGLDPSSVTRAVGRLEGALGCRLFHRTTRHLTLTAAGERLLARAAGPLDILSAALADAADQATAPTGTVRLAASVGFGVQCVVPRLAQWSQRHPAIMVDLHLADHVVDLAREQIDLALRLSAARPTEGVSQRLRQAHYRVCASPAYAAQHGTPAAPAEIARHKVVTFDFADFTTSWVVDGAPTPLGEVRTITNALGLRAAVLSGFGISLLADWLVEADLAAGTMIDCFPGATVGPADGAAPSLWLVRPDRRYTPRAVDALRPTLIDAFAAPAKL